MFDSATFLTARFETDQFRFEGDKVSEVAGNFTLLGKTHPLTLKATNFNCYQHPTLKCEGVVVTSKPPLTAASMV